MDFREDNSTETCEKYYFVFDIECAHEFQFYRKWSQERSLLPITVITLYLLMIHYGKKIMEDRKPFQIKNLLFAWNTSLAVFSIAGSFRAIEDVSSTISRHGFHPSICVIDSNRVSGFWVFAFVMSKFFELGDTLLLIVRKKPIMFLHWYHHLTVLLYSWYVLVTQSSTGRYFMIMNFFAHSLMYTYYALQSANIKAPLFVSITITTLQILQMVGGIYVIIYTWNELNAGRPCNQAFGAIIWGLLIYGSYFLLFLHYFIKAYILKRSPKKVVYRSKDKLLSSIGQETEKKCVEKQTSTTNNNNNNNCSSKNIKHKKS